MIWPFYFTVCAVTTERQATEGAAEAGIHAPVIRGYTSDLVLHNFLPRWRHLGTGNKDNLYSPGKTISTPLRDSKMFQYLCTSSRENEHRFRPNELSNAWKNCSITSICATSTYKENGYSCSRLSPRFMLTGLYCVCAAFTSSDSRRSAKHSSPMAAAIADK